MSGSGSNHKEVITTCSGSDCAGLHELEPCVEGREEERQREWERGAGSKRGRRKRVTDERQEEMRRIHTDGFLIVSLVGVVEMIEVIPSLTLWNKLTKRVRVYSLLFSIQKDPLGLHIY